MEDWYGIESLHSNHRDVKIKRYTIKRCYNYQELHSDGQNGRICYEYYKLLDPDGNYLDWGHTSEECEYKILVTLGVDIEYDYEDKLNDD